MSAVPSPPDSQAQSPAALLVPLASPGSRSIIAGDLPAPPLLLPPHLLPSSATSRSSSSNTIKPSTSDSYLRRGFDGSRDSCSSGWGSYALTPEPSVDSMDGARSSRAGSSGAFTSGTSSSSSSSSSSDERDTSRPPSSSRGARQKAVLRGTHDGCSLASPFAGAAEELLTPPLEKSEDEGGIIRRRVGLGVDLGHEQPERATLSDIYHRPLLSMSPSTSNVLQPPMTGPPSPRTPPTPFLRTVDSRTFISTITTTTTTAGARPRTVAAAQSLLPSGHISSADVQPGDVDGGSSGARAALRTRTVSTGVLEGASPPGSLGRSRTIGGAQRQQQHSSRPASVRDWQSDDEDGFEPVVVTLSMGSARRPRTTSSPSTAAAAPSPRGVRSGGGTYSYSAHGTPQTGFKTAPLKAKPVRSAPDSRTNLVGMLSAALSLSSTAPSGALAALDGTGTPSVKDDPSNQPPPPPLALTGPIPVLSKALTAPIAPLAHVFAFMLISLAAAVALSTVLVGSYGLTAWDVTRLRVREARATVAGGRRRIEEGVKRGRRLIEGAVDGAREIAEGLVDSASAGLDEADGASRSTAAASSSRGSGANGRSSGHAHSRTASGDSASTGSSPRKHARQRSAFVGGGLPGASTSADDWSSWLADAFWRVAKRVVPAATVRKVLEAAEVRLGKRPAHNSPSSASTGSRSHRRARTTSSSSSRAEPLSASGRSYWDDPAAAESDHHPRPSSSNQATPHSSLTAAYEFRFAFTPSASTTPPTSAARSPNLGYDAPSDLEPDEKDSPRASSSRRSRHRSSKRQQQQQQQKSALPPRPPLSVLIPSILLTLVIAFGAMAYEFLRKNAPPAKNQAEAEGVAARDPLGMPPETKGDKSRRRRHV